MISYKKNMFMFFVIANIFLGCMPKNYIRPSPFPIDIYPNHLNLISDNNGDYWDVSFMTNDSPQQVIQWYDTQIPANWKRYHYNAFSYQAMNLDLKCYHQTFIIDSTTPSNGQTTITINSRIVDNSC